MPCARESKLTLRQSRLCGGATPVCMRWRVPSSRTLRWIASSSSTDHSALVTAGLRWLYHRSRHCFPERPPTCAPACGARVLQGLWLLKIVGYCIGLLLHLHSPKVGRRLGAPSASSCSALSHVARQHTQARPHTGTRPRPSAVSPSCRTVHQSLRANRTPANLTTFSGHLRDQPLQQRVLVCFPLLLLQCGLRRRHRRPGHARLGAWSWGGTPEAVTQR